MRALVVGGGGATGVQIVQELSARGWNVTILHRGIHEPPELAPYQHLHADPHFAGSVEDVLEDRSFDLVILTYGRLEAMAKLFAGRCERLIAIGGVPIYGGYLDPASVFPAGMPLLANERTPLANPAAMSHPKAAGFAAKMAQAERTVLDHHERGAYCATLFRYPSIYGPRSLDVSDWSLIKRIRDGRPYILLPDAGLATVSRCAALNAAHCVLLALDCEAAGGHVFNCADDQQYTLAQWVELSMAAIGSTVPLVKLPPSLDWAAGQYLPLGGTTSTMALVDASKSRTMLGYRDRISPAVALAEAIAWRLDNPPRKIDLESGGDRFDYAMEDQVVAALSRMEEQCAALRREQTIVHPYPHPKEPSLVADHRGR